MDPKHSIIKGMPCSNLGNVTILVGKKQCQYYQQVFSLSQSFQKFLILIIFTLNCLINKGLGSRRGEIGPAIEMHTNLKYVYMVYFIEKN